MGPVDGVWFVAGEASTADVLGHSLGGVKIRLHRARDKLKAALEAKCTFHRDERNVFGCEPKLSELIDLRPKK